MEIALLLFIYSLLSILCALAFNLELLFLIKLIVFLIFTPVLGYLILKKVKRYSEDQLIITHYFCRKCGLESTDDEEFCPSCMNEGELTKLIACKMKLI